MQENGKAKGEYRCLTLEEIKTTVVMFRKQLGWKQLTLAIEAGVDVRTVQRIERGEKVNDDTLKRVAKALRLQEDGFVGARYIPSQEELLAQVEQMQKELMVTEAHVFATVKDCDAVLGAGHGYIVDDRAMPEGMAEQIAKFKDLLIDWADIYGDVSHTERLDACRSVLEELHKIEEQGYQTRYGVYTTEDRFTVAVIVFGDKNDERFLNLSQLIVSRQFTKLALAGMGR